ncbi:MAG: hypothetical protein A3H97_04650 [Acidobacteria bacterium RIFCSPLOWO2_02_FULL_65_29]|nr:MAG: hypothetical protein A3H97_04650 [Acidobacteria bacterium RIFCSPLOWO2_02_FULL_65_29]
MSNVAPVVIGSRLGQFIIHAALGAGGMGEVYEAEDTRLHRRVALKVVRQDVAADPVRRMRLEREASAVAMLNHPHIEMATGRRPFNGPSALSVLTSIAKDTPPLASEINPAVPAVR